MAIYIGLGSNLGQRALTLGRALAALEQRGVELQAQSSLYESAPVGIPSRQPFLNAAIRVQTEMHPQALLSTLLEVEHLLGRRRDHPDGDRTCDLDLLLHGEAALREAALELPHPRIRDRRFVLLPLLELNPDLCDPRTGTPYAQDAERLADDPAQRCIAVADPSAWGGAGG